MTEQFAEALVGALDWLPKELVVFVISMLPILECRGGLIAASLMGLSEWIALPIAIVGNLLPIPFILLFIEKIFAKLKNTRFVKLVDKLEQKAEKGAKKIMKYKTFGLFLFVAIPLPGTGAWTGALVAALFKFKFKDAIKSIIPGVLTATAIMYIITYFIPSVIVPWIWG